MIAAAEQWPEARLLGRELDPTHVAAAQATLQDRAEVARADFFSADWPKELAALEEPILVLGNPPWVTTATLGALGSDHAPERARVEGRSGLASMTGASNFDVSEWLLRRLLDALAGRRFTLAMLIKSSVARRLVEQIGARPTPLAGALHRIDAKRHFDATVDATLFLVRPEAGADSCRWPVFDSLRADRPARVLGLVDGVLTADLDAFERTRVLAGQGTATWRSGLKHDCARVMELRPRRGGGWASAAGGEVDLEPTHVYPLLKGSDVANHRLTPARAVIVPQTALGQPTATLRDHAPKTWAYLNRHRAALDARRSRIYRGRPPFSVFGVGPYTFAPYKVAIAGLYPRLAFELVSPHDGRPVVLDDTCYFLPFEEQAQAEEARELLRSKSATEFFEARIFRSAKRPITKALLSALDLSKLPQP